MNSVVCLNDDVLARAMNHEAVTGIGSIFIVNPIVIRVASLCGVVVACIENNDAELVRSNSAVAVSVVFIEIDKSVTFLNDIVDNLVRRALVVIATEIAKSCGMRERHR